MSVEPIKILLVDDDEEDYGITRELLSENNPNAYEIEWVNSYERALEAMTVRQHDIYLIDFWLGSHNGLELLKEAQDHGCDVPMILLTGIDDQMVDTEAMRAGAADFLCKGDYTSKSLERSIRYAIERSRAEKKIQKLAAFPRANPNPVLAFDATGAMTYYNEAAEKLAISLGEKSPLAIVPSAVRAIVAGCLLTGENTVDLQTATRNRTISWSFIPIAASKTVHCYATDITERLSLEAQVRHSVKMEAVGQLAAGVAHDFNNILTIILGHSDLLSKNKTLGSECHKPVQHICDAAERAGKIIRQLLMFSRRHAVQARILDLNEAVGNLSGMLKVLAGEQVTLQFQPAPRLAPVRADQAMMEQILINLVMNARDAMPQGGTLTVSTGRQKLDPVVSSINPDGRMGDFITLTVQDTGRGMDERTLGHLFEPFFTTKEVGKGSGLGLATIYGIVKQHQGWIVVTSHLGEGSTFTIYLPALPTEAAALPSRTLNEGGVMGGNEGILVVEDEAALRELVVSVLQLYGYRTFEAETGSAALRVWDAHKGEIDLLLTDMVMPEGMSGPQLAGTLAREMPHLKVIYTSGYSPGILSKDIAMLEEGNFLPKPYKPIRLAQMIRERLDKKEAQGS